MNGAQQHPCPRDTSVREQGNRIALHLRSSPFQARFKFSRKHEQLRLSLQLLTFSMTTAGLLGLLCPVLYTHRGRSLQTLAGLLAPAGPAASSCMSVGGCRRQVGGCWWQVGGCWRQVAAAEAGGRWRGSRARAESRKVTRGVGGWKAKTQREFYREREKLKEWN